MAVKPLKDNVVVQPEVAPNVSRGGILMVSNPSPVEYGVVVSMGINVTELKAGDRVAYYPRSGSVVSDSGLLIMKESSVLAVVYAT